MQARGSFLRGRWRAEPALWGSPTSGRNGLALAPLFFSPVLNCQLETAWEEESAASAHMPRGARGVRAEDRSQPRAPLGSPRGSQATHLDGYGTWSAHTRPGPKSRLPAGMLGQGSRSLPTAPGTALGPQSWAGSEFCQQPSVQTSHEESFPSFGPRKLVAAGRRSSRPWLAHSAPSLVAT